MSKEKQMNPGILLSAFALGPFKYYVIKELGGWGGHMMMFDDKVGEKNDTWNIRSLGDETIVPSTQQPSVLY